MKRPTLTPPKKKADKGAVQGEGDYRSAREFNEKERAFVRSHDTQHLGRKAAPEDAKQAAELEGAERTGKARARPDPESKERSGTRDDATGATDVNSPNET
jgi:hypothetical protein